HDAAQLVVNEYRAIAALPVEGDETVGADRLILREFGEVFVDAEAAALRLLVVTAGHLVLHVPGEDVADSGLAGLVAVETRDDASVDHAAHAGNLLQHVAVHHVTGGGAHDGEHLAGLDRARRGCRDVGVDVADSDGDALGEAGPGGSLRGQR